MLICRLQRWNKVASLIRSRTLTLVSTVLISSQVDAGSVLKRVSNSADKHQIRNTLNGLVLGHADKTVQQHRIMKPCYFVFCSIMRGV